MAKKNMTQPTFRDGTPDIGLRGLARLLEKIEKEKIEKREAKHG